MRLSAAALLVLTAASLAGCGSSSDKSQVFTAAPLARLRVPRFGEPGAQLLFDAGDALSPGGALLHFRFNFGDGSPAIDAGVPRLHHPYAAEGVYQVALEVEDLLGHRARVQGQVTVRSGAPVCRVDADCAKGDLCQEARCTTEVGSTDR